MRYSEETIIGMGLTPKATYGGNVVSFTSPATGDYVWDVEALTGVLGVIQRKANKLVAERNRKLRALFASQSKQIPAAGYAAHQGAVDSHGTQDSVPAGRPTNSPPYGEWCRNPKACAGKGYCPLDPTCGD